MAGIWGTKKAAPLPMRLAAPPRWLPHPNALSFTRRIDFDPGAPAFAYDLYGPVEYPVLAGFNNKYQWSVFQPPVNIYPRELLAAGLGQSSGMQPPAPAAETIFPPDQLNALIQMAQNGGTYFGD